MKSSFFLIAIVLLTNCTSENTSKKNHTKTTSIKVTNSTDTSKDETNKSIYVLKQNDTLYYKKGDSILLKTFLSPLKKDLLNEEIIINSLDEYALVANLLLIFRNVSYSQKSDVIPEINTVEIYNENGWIKTIHENDKKSKTLLSFDFTDNFNGNKFSNKTNEFGAILIEAEGNLYGYLHINKDAKITEVTLDQKFNIQGEMYTTTNGVNNELVWEKLTNDYVPITFTINKDAEYTIK